MEDSNSNMEQSGASRVSEQEQLLRQSISSAISAGGGIKKMNYETGIPRGTLEKYAAATSTPSFLNAAKISSSLGISLDDLAGLDRSIFGGGNGGHHDSGLDQPGMIRLPIYSEVRASAGPGAMPASELADSMVAFDPRFLRSQGAVPDRCAVIWAHGDSMMPTIPDGAALIVDHSQTEVKNGSIMVISVGDDLLVKRIRRRMDGLIDLISDNPAYQPETLAQHQLDQLRVVGRVVYFGRTP